MRSTANMGKALWERITGMLVVRSAVIDLCQDKWRHTPLTNRTTLVRGGFFDSSTIAAGADAYMLKQTLHEWDDEHAVLILRQLIEAAGSSQHTARLLVIDRFIWPHASFIASHGAAFIDFAVMDVIEGGCQRYEEVCLRLFDRAGLEWRGAVETRSVFAVMECLHRRGGRVTRETASGCESD